MTKKKAPDGDKEVATTKQETAGTKGPSNDPQNAMSDIKDNSVSVDELARKKKGDEKGAKLAAQDADTVERIKAETEEERREESISIHDRLARSGYVYNENQITGERWVGESIQLDPDADSSSKAKTRVTSIAEYPPRTGLTVKPKGGEPFALGEIGRDAKPDAWFAVINPSTNKPFLESV